MALWIWCAGSRFQVIEWLTKRSRLNRSPTIPNMPTSRSRNRSLHRNTNRGAMRMRCPLMCWNRLNSARTWKSTGRSTRCSTGSAGTHRRRTKSSSSTPESSSKLARVYRCCTRPSSFYLPMWTAWDSRIRTSSLLLGRRGRARARYSPRLRARKWSCLGGRRRIGRRSFIRMSPRLRLWRRRGRTVSPLLRPLWATLTILTQLYQKFRNKSLSIRRNTMH